MTTVVIVPEGVTPDAFFGEEEQQRLQSLMGRWRLARDGQGQALSPEEQAELTSLVEAEVEASARRAAPLFLFLGEL